MLERCSGALESEGRLPQPVLGDAFPSDRTAGCVKELWLQCSWA